ANIDVDIDEEDQALVLLASLPSLYYNFVETLLYGRETLTLEDVLSILNSRELKKGQMKRMMGYENGDLLMVGSEAMFLEWIMDPGSSYHMTPRRNFLFDFKKFNGGMASLGDNKACAIRGTGNMRVQMKEGSCFMLENVCYIPELKRNFISLGTLDRERKIVCTPWMVGLNRVKLVLVYKKMRVLPVDSGKGVEFEVELQGTSDQVVDRQSSKYDSSLKNSSLPP
nr:zinc finger, CCHC-type [Tanacetum cinerariifolium]